MFINEKTALNTRAKLFRGFGDPSRLSILETLMNGPRKVHEIVDATGLTQPNVSGHLACLRDCGLVESEQAGKYVVYRLSDARIHDMIDLAGGLVADVARGVYECTRYEPDSGLKSAAAENRS